MLGLVVLIFVCIIKDVDNEENVGGKSPFPPLIFYYAFIGVLINLVSMYMSIRAANDEDYHMGAYLTTEISLAINLFNFIAFWVIIIWKVFDGVLTQLDTNKQSANYNLMLVS